MRTRLFPVVLFAAAVTAQSLPTLVAPALQRSRAVWFTEGANPIAGEVCAAFEPLAWDATRERHLRACAAGDHVALGEQVWASLSSFNDLDFGKAGKVPAGDWRLALERSKDGWLLAFVDASRARADGLPAKETGKLPIVARVPLREAAAGPAQALSLAFAPSESGGTLTLRLRFGPHTWATDAKVQGIKGASPVAMSEARGCSVLTFDSKAPGRQAMVVLDHGMPTWSDTLASAAAKLQKGQRWRLGQNWWTTLDNNVPLQIGDKELAAGQWHLALEKTATGYALVIGAATVDQKQKLDAFGAQNMVATMSVPLTVAEGEPASQQLSVRFATKGNTAQLVVRFGTAAWSVPVGA